LRDVVKVISPEQLELNPIDVALGVLVEFAFVVKAGGRTLLISF